MNAIAGPGPGTIHSQQHRSDAEPPSPLGRIHYPLSRSSVRPSSSFMNNLYSFNGPPDDEDFDDVPPDDEGLDGDPLDDEDQGNRSDS